MKKNTSYKVQVSAGTLILAMRDYFQARREGRTEEMEAQLRPLPMPMCMWMKKSFGMNRKRCRSMYQNGIIKNLLSKNFLDFERSCG